MTDLDETLRALRNRIDAAARARVRAEHERDAATAQARRASTALQEEFGVSTVDQARVMLDELRSRYTAEITTLTEALDKAGA